MDAAEQKDVDDAMSDDEDDDDDDEWLPQFLVLIYLESSLDKCPDFTSIFSRVIPWCPPTQRKLSLSNSMLNT